MRLLLMFWVALMVANVGFAQSNGGGPYRIHIEDVLYITVWNEPSLSQETPVALDGSIAVPLMGTVMAAGKTQEELAQLIKEFYKEKKLFNDPQVVVTVRQFHRPRVAVLGMVNRPGVYDFKQGDRVLEGLSLGGNFMPDRADMERGRLERADGTVLPLNLRALLEEGDSSQNVELKDGDSIVVPEDLNNKIFVGGEVNRPGQFQWRPRMTVVDALSQAGWNREQGRLSRAYVVRQSDDGEPERINVDMIKLLSNADTRQNIELQRGDVVFVPKTNTPDVDKIYRTLSLAWLLRNMGLARSLWRP